MPFLGVNQRRDRAFIISLNGRNVHISVGFLKLLRESGGHQYCFSTTWCGVLGLLREFQLSGMRVSIAS